MKLATLNINRLQHILAEDQNRWMTEPDVLANDAPPWHRQIMRVLTEILLNGNPKTHHIIKGPRRSGKSTLLWQTLQKLREEYQIQDEQLVYFQMDHPELVREPLGNIVEALLEIASDATATAPLYLFIDEIAASEGWEGWMKMFSDGSKPVRILASSSAFTYSNGGDSGIGRWATHTLMPCSFMEYVEMRDMHSRNLPSWCWTWHDTLKGRLESIPIGTANDPTLKQYASDFVLFGGYPQCVSNSEPSYSNVTAAHEILRGIAELVTEHDIPDMQQIRDRKGLRLLLHSCAVRMCTQTLPSKIGKPAGLKNAETTSTYLELIEMSDLISRIRPYIEPEKEDIAEEERQKSYAPRQLKILFRDTAMASAIRRTANSTLQNDNTKGQAYENIVGSALKELADITGAELNFWRYNENYESDFIFDAEGPGPLAVEVSSSISHKRTGLRKTVEKMPQFQNSAYLLAPETPIIHTRNSVDGVAEMPIFVFLLACSAQATQSSLVRGGHIKGQNYRVSQTTQELLERPSTNTQPVFKDGDIVFLTEHEAEKALAKQLVKPAR